MRRTTLGLLTAGALLAAPLLGGCSFLSGSDDAASAQPGATSTAPVGGAESGEQRTIGPLDIMAADYWYAKAPKGGITHVTARGCEDGKPCPGFDIITGDAVTQAVGDDGTTAYLPKGTKCPGKDALTPSVSGDHEPTVTKTVVAGSEATRSEIVLACVDDDGNVGLTTTQIQWYVPNSPEGPVLVVDRWAFDGLDARLAAATWAG
ncbi:hypothetical protein [Luteimicrobium subarcticum]|uniref:Lipoprotein n=1 Tax=Luteimicrobium subarcticum TaxID=620910 RepID=A0A2M8WVY6_9MICO|nr:hypothetical protein [Luteimicrobium subarcticum]PJI95081.1 hypothetical protein CLV34_0934 [Luteimicrobium subarcticum]